MLPLANLLRDVIDPTLIRLERLTIGRPSQSARAMLLAIHLQEDPQQRRVQVLTGGGRGPARGLWQFERGGGVAGVMRHPTTKSAAIEICRIHRVPFGSSDIWSALEAIDPLACAFARLLLWSDPLPLPEATEAAEQRAWQCYLRNWRPGKPHADRWPGNWSRALLIIREMPL